MNVPMPKNSRTPHPTGPHKGVFYEVEDAGFVDTAFGSKHRLYFKIESTTAHIEEGDLAGRPYTIWMTANVSNDPRSNLRKFRRTVLGRELDEGEANAQNFDPEVEFVGKRIGYTVIHAPNTREPGGPPWANIDNFWMDEEGQTAADASGATDTVKNASSEQKVVNEQVTSVSEIRGLEESLRFPPSDKENEAWSAEKLIEFRNKHLSDDMRSPDTELMKYLKALREEAMLMGVDLLPF